MATPAYTLIDSTTLGSSAASVTFSGISATGKGDLVLVISAKAVEGNGVVRMRINGDSGASYYSVAMFGTGSTASSSLNSGFNQQTLTHSENSISTSTFNLMKVELQDYSATDKHKSYLIRSNESSFTAQALAGRWASTSALTSLYIYGGGFTNFAIGSTFHLYQIVSE